MLPILPSTAPAHVITLVHGTFSNANIGSPEFKAWLEQELPGPVLFSEFCWTGKNSQVSRLGAARRLRSHLAGVIERHPAARHYVIGHSHGGTVALYALRHPGLRRRVDGVVCLGTPFLDATPRSLAGSIGWTLMGAAATIAALAVFVAARLFVWLVFVLDINTSTDSGLVLLLKFIAGLFLTCFPLFLVKEMLVAWPTVARRFRQAFFVKPGVHLRRWQNRARAAFPRFRLGVVPTLYVYFPTTDSAYRWLRLWARMMELPVAIVGWVVLPLVLAGNAVVVLALFAARPVVPSNELLNGVNWFVFESMYVLLYVLVGVANVGFFIGAAQIGLILSGFVRNRVWSFGSESVWSNWLIRIESSQHPFVESRLIDERRNVDSEVCGLQDIPRGLRLSEAVTRRHTFYYRSPSVAATIGRWIAAHRSRSSA